MRERMFARVFAGIACLGLVIAAGCAAPSTSESSDAARALPAANSLPARSMSAAPDYEGVPPREPRPLTPEEQAEAEAQANAEPNQSFVVVGEMIESTDEDIPDAPKPRIRKIEPAPHPPVALNLDTGEATILDREPAFEASEANQQRGTAGPRTPALEASFQGMSGSFIFPPDPTLSVGPDNVISAVNVQFRIHTKAGGGIAQRSQSSFFGASISGDARMIYDPDSQRYFAMTWGTSGTPGNVRVAMSKDSSPGNLNIGAGAGADWLGWTFNWSGSNNVPDFPQIGVDKDAIYLTANVFSSINGFFTNVQLIVVPKAQLLAGSTTPTSTVFTNIRESWTGANSLAFNIVPTVTYGDPGIGILAQNAGRGTVTRDGNTLNVRFWTLWIVSDPAGSPGLDDYPVFYVDSPTNTPNAQQQGTTTRLDAGGGKLRGLTYRDGSLWGAVTGRNTAAAPDTAEVIWAEIDVMRAISAQTEGFGWEQSGFVSSNDRFYFYPKVTVDEAGNAGMVMNGSSTSEFAGIWYTARASDDPEGTFQAPALMKAGISSYVDPFGGSPSRWGDYSGIAVDPADEMTFWATSEWARSSSGWGTWIASFSLPAQTTTLPFFEDFESGARGVTPGLWSLITGTVDGVGVNEPSASNSARLNGPQRGQDQFRTRQIDLSGFSNVELSYSMQRGGGGVAPDFNAVLFVDYVNTDGNWANLAKIPGNGLSETTYTQFKHILPANAYHEHGRIRFQTVTDFTGDDFFIDDVSIRDCTAVDADSDGVGDVCDTCIDADSDGYGQGGFDQSGCDFVGDDCNDNDASHFPGAPESCNAIDENCDGVDGSLPDPDGDGVGEPCDLCPNEPSLIEPDEPGAEASCGDSVDNDCDGLTDDADPDCVPACICADFDLNGTVNLVDFSSFAVCFNQNPVSNPGCACADMNVDGSINLVDFNTFSILFNSSPTNSPPDCTN